MGQHREQQFWEQLVAEVEGGARQAEIARRYGISVSNLARWARRLKEERPRAQLLPVRVTAGPSRRPCGLLVDGVRLEFEEGTDPAYVAAVARALRSC
ncbi:helix-turn-helix domain-containing protein [Sorangium sp. So ce315]|uniref:IS66 family insertion sequence element accessory protein TnpA n=1 Tax=Sorangium sp. So ce315 TaxID=3133299 RepID=UPI003F5EF30B